MASLSTPSMCLWPNNAGQHARQIVSNIEYVVSVELLTPAHALELRMRLPATAGAKPGVATEKIPLIYAP